MAVQMISLSCNHCGAPLEAPPEARFLTCAHCGSRLTVQRTGSAYYTSVLEKIEHTTEAVAEDVATIRQQNELERLDREWAMKRETMLVRSKDGDVSEPDQNVGSTLGALFALVFGVIWTCIAGALAPPMALFGIVFICVAVYGLISGQTKAADYSAAKAEYQRKRDELVAQLERQTR